MKRRSKLLAILILVFLFSIQGYSQDKTAPHNGPPPEKTVEQVKKNIKVLTGMPASQFNSVMDYFTASLGVGCDHCHASDASGHIQFESDEKDAKKTAREMITMVKALNEDHFNGKLSVTCYTCHRGSTEPMRMPQLPIAARPKEDEHGPEHAKLPKIEDLLSAYENALGGADAIAKIKTRVTKAILTRDGNELPLEMTQMAPDRYAGTMTVEGRGDFTNVYNGHDVWSVMKDGSRPLPETERIRLSREAPMFPLQHMRDLGEMLQLRGTDTVNGKSAYVLFARIGDNIMERYYIDSATSLLIRRNVLNKTMLSWIPDQCDYEDYRTVDGVKIPFVMRYSYVNSRNNSIHRFTDVKQNVAVDEKLFAMPEMKAPDMRERR
ncbi:MAG: c-type cytochrome [Bacteroidota bacterium]